MIRRLLLISVLLLAASCGTTSGTGHSIGDIRAELDRGACQIRMDDLAFELETGVYHGWYDASSLDSVIAAMPDSIVCCPGTLTRYRIVDDEGPVIVCPLGHGSAPLIL
jgi:hypothetical protein